MMEKGDELDEFKGLHDGMGREVIKRVKESEIKYER